MTGKTLSIQIYSESNVVKMEEEVHSTRGARRLPYSKARQGLERAAVIESKNPRAVVCRAPKDFQKWHLTLSIIWLYGFPHARVIRTSRPGINHDPTKHC